MLYKFGVFEFDEETQELRKNGRVTAIEPQPAKALALLLSRAGDIVTREELRGAVWGADTHVDFDRGLAYCISQVRAALGDSGEHPRFVRTIPKKGFEFIAPVTPAEQAHLTARDASRGWAAGLAVAGLIALMLTAFAALFVSYDDPSAAPVVIAVSVFDNETGNPDYDRPVAGLSDLVVEHLTKLAPDRVAVVGNAAILRQPRNIRNLRAVAQNVKADYVLLGQLQQGETGLRFITHFIRLRDEAHLKANRLAVADASLAGLESAVVGEFDRAVREHVLTRPSN